MKKITLIALVLAIFTFGSGFGFYNYFTEQVKAVNLDNSELTYVEIPVGTSPSKVGEVLLENNLINDLNIYKIYIKLNNQGSEFKAGKYNFSQSMDLYDICALLNSGSNVLTTKNITIPEGLSLKELAVTLSNQTNINESTFIALSNDVDSYALKYTFLQNDSIKSLEGYLYPNTYNIYIDSTEDDIIIKMLDEFQLIYESTIKPNLKDDMDLNSIMTMASIIEGEALLDSERPIVSSVFYNRIAEGWKLESCATVQYALGERKSTLTFDDLKTVSDYNTYLHTDLPPAPINSPGLESIKAALFPETTEYMFFLAKGDGSHYFTDNYDDFLEAKNKYIK